MRRYKKVIIWVAVADLLLLAALLVLCVLVDRRVDVGRSEKTSSTLDGVVSRATTKDAEFGRDIFDRPCSSVRRGDGNLYEDGGSLGGGCV